MPEVKSRMRGFFNTIDDLENRCNLTETSLDGGKLLSVEAIGTAVRHETVGTFEETPGKPFGAGNKKFTLGGTNTAWINGKKENVSFT